MLKQIWDLENQEKAAPLRAHDQKKTLSQIFVDGGTAAIEKEVERRIVQAGERVNVLHECIIANKNEEIESLKRNISEIRSTPRCGIVCANTTAEKNRQIAVLEYQASHDAANILLLKARAEKAEKLIQDQNAKIKAAIGYIDGPRPPAGYFFYDIKQILGGN